MKNDIHGNDSYTAQTQVAKCSVSESPVNKNNMSNLKTSNSDQQF